MGSYRLVVQEIRARSREFNFVDFVHEGRQSNVDAHNLDRSSIYADYGRHAFIFLMAFVLLMNISKGMLLLKYVINK